MSTVCKIQVAGFLLQCCFGVMGTNIKSVLFCLCEAAQSPSYARCPSFIFFLCVCLFDAQTSDKKLDMAVAAMHSSVVRV